MSLQLWRACFPGLRSEHSGGSRGAEFWRNAERVGPAAEADAAPRILCTLTTNIVGRRVDGRRISSDEVAVERRGTVQGWHRQIAVEHLCIELT